MNVNTLCVNCKKNNSCTRCWKTSNKRCPYFNQKTNADIIRSMSDQGLAMCLYEIGYVGGWYSKKDALVWLQQPAEVSE